MCTGYNQQKEKTKAFALGADEYLVKPIEKKDLEEILEKYYKL
jgi:YesN/AraC family two-component response regulator